MERKWQGLVAYEAPKVEIIEVEVEKGFSASNGDIDSYGIPVDNGGWS